MDKKLKMSVAIFALGLLVLLVSACSRSHSPLNELYYGDYNNENTERYFVIITFSYKEPNKIAMRKNLDDIKINVVRPVKYNKNSIFIKTKDGGFKLLISKDGRTLTCPSCNGTDFPKVFKVGIEKGKPYGKKTAKIAFDAIAKDSKINGGTITA